MKRFTFPWLPALTLGLIAVSAWVSTPAGISEAAPQPLRLAELRAATFPSITSAITATEPTTGSAVITAVDVKSFPDLVVYLAVNDADSQHVGNLPPEAFTLVENSTAIPAGKLAVTEKEVGIQAVFAIDTSAPFKTRDVNAVTRMDYIKQALLAFGTQQAAPRMADGIDDVTLLAPEGILAAHTNQGLEFANALATYTTTFSGAANPLPLINQALDFASETMPRPGMPRYIVLFSNGIVVNGQAIPLTDLVARAQGAQVAIFTIYVGPGGTSDSVGGQSLRKLADLTGGRFLVLEKPETLAPLLNYLADQRLQYQLRYRSSIAATGQQSFSVQLKLPNGSQLTSNAAAFPLRIEAPTLTLSSLPSVIQLSASASASEVISYSVPVAVDFPDGHPRNLRSLELVADGQVIDQVLAPDAGSMTLRWTLNGYPSGGSHTLLARAVDELGFQAQSSPVVVNLAVGDSATQAVPPTATTTPAVGAAPTLTPYLWAGVFLLTVAVVISAGGLWWARKNAGARQGTSHRDALLRGGRVHSQTEVIEPVRDSGETIPLPARPASPSSPPARPLARPPAFTFHAPALFPKKRTVPPAKPQGKAYLEVVEGGSAPREAIEILGPVLRLGRDATRAEVVFRDRSMSRLHARIVEAPEGVFRVYDEGSTSGTWINFTQIPAEGGWELKSGDLINLGRIQLRFKRRAQVSSPSAPTSSAGAKPGLPDLPAATDGATEPYRPLKK